MKKLLIAVLLGQLASQGVSAAPLNLSIADKTYTNNQQANVAPENSFKELKIEDDSKSIVPVVLSVSFLFMSLYGDNPQSGMYRAIGAGATGASLSWYFD